MTKPKVKLLTEIYDRKAKVNRFVELDQWYETVKVQVKEWEKLKKELLEETADTTDLTQPLVIVGDKGKAIYSEGKNETIITDKSKLIKRLTQPIYNEHSNISLTTLKNLLSGNELKTFIKEERGKSRNFKEVILFEKHLTACDKAKNTGIKQSWK